jgi:hypothetical protein
LFEYDGTLFCGHDSGTFIIEKASVKNIFENQELGNLNRFPVKRAFTTRQLLWDFGIGKGQQSVAFQE